MARPHSPNVPRCSLCNSRMTLMSPTLKGAPFFWTCRVCEERDHAPEAKRKSVRDV